jgi:hypothetical protein
VSELAYKRRLRAWKRRIATNLTLQGYEVETYETSPFHVGATRGRTCRKIRIEFGYITDSDINAVGAVRSKCLREIWQISADGRTVVKAKVAQSRKE